MTHLTGFIIAVLAFSVGFLFWRQRTLSRRLDSLRGDHDWARKEAKRRLDALEYPACTCEACVSVRKQAVEGFPVGFAKRMRAHGTKEIDEGED